MRTDSVMTSGPREMDLLPGFSIGRVTISAHRKWYERNHHAIEKAALLFISYLAELC
jgi:hypothetical protein